MRASLFLRRASIPAATLAFLGSLTGSVACRRTAPTPAGPAEVPELPALLAGCVAVHRTDGCLVAPKGAVRVWVQRPTVEELAIFAGDVALRPEEITAVRGGVRFSVSLPEGARRLRLRAPEGEVELPLGPAPALPAFGAFRERLETKHDEPGALAFAEAAKVDASAIDRVALSARVGNVHMARGRFREGEASLREAFETSLAEGFVSGPAHHACALAHAFSVQGRYAEARSILDDAKRRIETSSTPRPLLAESLARLSYCAAFPARAVDDTRAALRWLRAAEELGDKLALAELLRSVRSTLGLELLFLGRGREGLELLRENEVEGDACVAGDAAFDLGSAALVERSRRASGPGEVLVDPRPALLRASTLYAQGCPDPERQSHVAALLAWAELLDGRVEAAEKALASSVALAKEPGSQQRIQRLILEGRIALARKRLAEARASFRRASALAELRGHRADRLWALDGLAEAFAASGANAEAAATLEQAEALFDELALGVPLGEGRGLDFGAREGSTRRLVELHLRMGRPDRALATVRRARARVLLGLRRSVLLEPLPPAHRARFEEALGAYRAARDVSESGRAEDWTLPLPELEALRDRRRSEERERRAALDAAFARLASGRAADPATLPPWQPRAGEAYLAVGQLPTGLVAFWLDTNGLTTATMGELSEADAAARATALLAPFRERLASTRRLHVVLPAPLRSVDVHAAHVGSEPVLTQLAVDYPLDVASTAVTSKEIASEAGAKPPPASRSAVVVGNPSGNLPAAAVEAASSAERLRGRGWNVELLVGAAASRPALLGAFARADLFHFAGHAEFAGADGWDSELHLAGDTRLTLADVMALPRLPPRIVLLGCEAARTFEASTSETLGLAQAFVAAGAGEVVAPTRRVRDDDAQRFARAFYDVFHGAGEDMAEAVRAAQLVLLRDHEKGGVDWAAFRVLLP